MHSIVLSFFVFVLLTQLSALNFAYEAIQLTSSTIGDFADISFPDSKVPAASSNANPSCKAFPDTPEWPSDDEWSRLNSSLDGVLLRPLPAASVCYPGSSHNDTACRFLLSGARSTSFYIDDPLTVLSQWPQGNTCLASLNPQGNCTQGGFPVYVVNATTVKQVQVAVNFARNKNLRLVIKNTGHDFGGRSVGAGSLSIWTHFLKGAELIPRFTQAGGGYEGMAVRVGSGLEAFEQFNFMAQNGITILAPSCATVGAYGGWMSGGGHSQLSSLYGLGADQVLSLQIVTADGQLVTADAETNSDLFYAARGGGGSTYGVVTSAIVKAYPAINLTISSFSFMLNNGSSSNNSMTVANLEVFWSGVSAVYRFATTLVEAGGYISTTIIPGNNITTQLSVQLEMPGKTVSQASDLVQPLFDTLNGIGVPIKAPVPTTQPYGTPAVGTGDVPSNIRFASRIFPRINWGDDELFRKTMAAIRNVVQGGYVFHGLNMAPTQEVGGSVPTPAVLPAWRTAIMHADIFDTANMTAPAAQINEAHVRLNQYMAPIREVTAAGGGAYINEADVQEPNWQQSFFGENYEQLLSIKRERDPWGVFWAPTTVGSEEWAVLTADGLPSQNGMLCRVSL